MGDNYKGDSTLKTFPFFPCQKKNQIHQKKWAFFPHFYLSLSLINWKVSTYENQNWKIQGKSFCISLAIIVKYVILLMYMNCFFSLQYAMLVPAVVLFAFGILIYFCLIPSPDEIGEYKHLYKVVSHIGVTFIFWSDKIVSSKYS